MIDRRRVEEWVAWAIVLCLIELILMLVFL